VPRHPDLIMSLYRDSCKTSFKNIFHFKNCKSCIVMPEKIFAIRQEEFLFGSGPFFKQCLRFETKTFRRALPSNERQVPAEVRTHLIDDPKRSLVWEATS
jgi:hypothetical protein